MKITILSILLFSSLVSFESLGQDKRPREYGINFGVIPTGTYNAITDVAGVLVGHETIIEGDGIRTGVTTILPHVGNIFQSKVPAAIFIGNGFGKLAGYSQVKELGLIETPIVLTNTLSVPIAMQAVISYTLKLEGNEEVKSVNAVVGETNDGQLNDIRGMYINETHVLNAIIKAKSGPVSEGNVGAGTGTVCFGFKGGIGSSSRVLPQKLGGYTIGVLVQTNFGGVLEIAGVPVGQMMNKYPFKSSLGSSDGSCMIVVATDAPVDARNLERIAKRAMMGLANTGGIASNGSGDYVIAFSTYESNRVGYQSERTQQLTNLNNDYMSPLFMATIEATEEAIINSLFAAETMVGKDNNKVEELPVKEVLQHMKDHRAIK